MSGKVPPSSRARQRRASMPSRDSQVRRAALLFEKFTGHEATADMTVRVKVPPWPKVCANIGDVDGIMYTTVRDGRVEKYIHQFKAADKPMFAVSPDGKQLLLIGGAYDFTERGIVDASDPTSKRQRRR